ncbi:MAG: circularly permuted type 2 ATP-grasp protein [Alphaproteobacteria bacterium]|nr:circularly permuted type 2 ATP-grasp protein [Alphaproteobacteria bacterium]
MAQDGHTDDLFSDYEIAPEFPDEMFGCDGEPHPQCRELWAALRAMPARQIVAMQEQAERSFMRDGITFAVYGDDGAQERIIPIDFLPRIVSARDWRQLETGLAQRVKALNMFLADVYGAARILNDGVIPVDMVLGCPQYRVQMRGVELPHGIHVSVCGTDIIRDGGGFKVLEDNLRSPSGVSYMLANRQAVKTGLRDLFRRHSVRGIEHYTGMLRQTLADLSPRGNSDPCMVLLTPGIYNSAYYEHMFLAREMGIELVQGSDLLVHDGHVFMRTTGRLRQVDVIYRRIDDDFLDPLVFRPDSQLGVPGLFHAWRLGNVGIANAPGGGVADDKSVYRYVPDMIRYYLAEEPILANVETYLCRDPEHLAYVLDNLDTLVVKMVGESGGYGMLIGPHASRAERSAYAERVREDPANFIAQPTLALSRAPCLASGRAAPRHVDLRPFILQGRETRIVPGAFCRVALTPGSLVVNSSQGGGGKDLWVLDEPE